MAMLVRRLMPLARLTLICASLGAPSLWAQGGPPLLTDDPGTPGNRNWEINVAGTIDHRSGGNSYGVPNLDLNYGVGDRIQLNFQIPYLLTSSDGGPLGSGLGNSYAAVKWRFFENDKGWNVSTYPRIELNNPTDSVRRGFAPQGPNFLLPVEVTKTLGPLELDLEAGYWFSKHLADGNILGFAVGNQTTKKLEVLSEVYHISNVGGDHDDTFDFGGRYELRPSLLFIFSAGRSFHEAASGQSQFVGYFGLQFLIEKTHREP